MEHKIFRTRLILEHNFKLAITVLQKLYFGSWCYTVAGGRGVEGGIAGIMAPRI